MDDRIIVLDDESSILSILEQHLTAEGYKCCTTTSPQEALDSIADEQFSLLITDLKMPEMSGLDVVENARSLDKDLSIIVVTALIEVTNAIQAMRSGADDYLLKPFNLSEISISVAKVLEKRQLVLENRQYQGELEKRVRAATDDLKNTNRELTRTKEYLEKLLHSTADAILTTDSEGKIGFVNEGALRMLGYSAEEMIEVAAADFFSGGMDEISYIDRILSESKPLQNYETELRRKDGNLIPVNVSISRIREDNGLISTLAMCKDVTEQKRLQQELREMSIKDGLSGLYNQRYFYDRLETEIERSKRQKHPLSLLLFDIDEFKSYNDCHGHLEGDNVLKTAGSVVIESTREHVDIGFRYGGDEFTVILPEADEEQATFIAERIRSSFEAKRFDSLTLSIGLMTFKEGFSLRSFIQYADSMMYDAKRAGGNRIAANNNV